MDANREAYRELERAGLVVVGSGYAGGQDCLYHVTKLGFERKAELLACAKAGRDRMDGAADATCSVSSSDVCGPPIRPAYLALARFSRLASSLIGNSVFAAFLIASA